MNRVATKTGDNQEEPDHFVHLAAICPEPLIWERLVKDSDMLSGSHEPDGSGWNKQLGLQDPLVRNDFHLQAPRVRELTDGCLQSGDTSSSRGSDHVGTAAADLSYALLGRGEFAAQALDLTFHNSWKLFERIAVFGKLVLPSGELLAQRA